MTQFKAEVDLIVAPTDRAARQSKQLSTFCRSKLRLR